MERRKLLLAVFAIMFSSTLWAQKLNFYQVDTATYGMYIRGQWDALIQLSRKAHRQGIDSYYLKLRTGYAYFMKHKYLKAIPYFEKAYKENPDYEWTKQMLYYSYLYAGLDKAAMNIGLKLSYDSKIYQKLLENKLRSVDVNITRFYIPNYSDLISENYQLDEYEYNLTSSQTSFDLGLYYQLSDNLFFYHNAEFLKQNTILVTKTFPSNQTTIPLSTSQIKSYGRFSYYLGKRFTTNLNYNIISGIVQNPASFRGRTVITNSLFFNFSAGFSLEKQISLFKFKAGIDYLKLSNSLSATYTNTSITFYPLANTKLYASVTTFYGLTNEVKNNIIIAPELGYRLGKFYISAVYYYGTIYHLVTNDGYFVYNINEPISNLYGANLSYTTRNNSIFYIGFYPAQYTFSIENVQTNSSLLENTKINYLKLGMLWTF